ncbi:MAG: SDR family NAD(P)-dependent oxidoreductase, partial [Cyanobacteria bacterium J06621_11]
TTITEGKVLSAFDTLDLSVSNFLEPERKKNYPTEIAADDCYERLQRQGVTYGNSFRAIQQIYIGKNQVLSRLALPQSLLPTLETRYYLHPILLDACLQSIAALFIDDARSQTYLPAALEQMHVHIDGLEQLNQSLIECLDLWCQAKITHPSVGNWLTADIQLISAAGELLVSLTGLRLHPASKERVLGLASSIGLAESAANVEDWFYAVEWKPQSLPTPVDTQAIMAQAADGFSQAIAQPKIQSYLDLLPQLEQLSIDYATQAIATLNPDEVISSQHRLFEHLQRVLSRIKPQSSDSESSQQLLAKHPEAQAELTLIHRCGENLADVLTGKCDPLMLLFPAGDTSELTQLYQTSPGAQLMNQQIQQLMKTLVSPSAVSPSARPLRILEIGAGTGGTTAHLLPHIANADYTFTDISPLLLAKAKTRFSDYPNIAYRQLNIEDSLESQDFETNHYDLVIASNVLHATAEVTQALENVRSLLIPGGHFILLEGTQPLVWLDLIFGMTEGWWKRPTYPLLSVAQWQQSLQVAGFNSVLPLHASDNTLSERLSQTIIVANTSLKGDEHAQVAGKNYLILAEPTTDVGTQFAQALAQKTHGQLVWLEASDTILDLFSTISTSSQWPDKVVYLTDSSSLEDSDESGARLKATVQQTAVGLIELVRSLTEHTEAKPQLRLPQLNLVTQGLINIDTNGAVGDNVSVSQAPAWGIARVIELEHPGLNCRRIDLDPSETLGPQVDSLYQELQADTSERAISYRQGARRVARLCQKTSQTVSHLTPPSTPYKLSLPTKGSPDHLALVTAQRQSPKAEEVEIRVLAAGLNFIDVLDSLALLPFERDWLGVECAGEVVAVGEGVRHLAIGDVVLALAAGSFSQYVTVPVDRVVTSPRNLSAQAAATIPANFLTAHYALTVLAELNNRKPLRILIHSAAGGTGMAAVKIAQQADGAEGSVEIYATASPRKWDALKAMGVSHVMNSRTLAFADEIMAITDGQGVDIVFNSLSGEFIDKSLSVLAPDGCFLEIGKRGIWSQQKMAEARPDVTYHVIDLMTVAQAQPQRIQAMLRTLTEQFEAETLTPLCYRTFSIAEAPQAFRYMQQARHIGKIVFDVSGSEHTTAQEETERKTVAATEKVVVDPEGTYLITGGTGGLGIETAKWLVSQGARHIALLNRGTPKSVALESYLQQSLAQEVEILVLQADVTDYSQLQAAIATLTKTLPPLKGVIHAAGVLSDGVLQQLSWEQMETVLAPKVWGAWHLHQLTAGYDLDFFVLYSSAASLLGSPGQASHVAANSFLDALAHYRRSQHLPAVSINWGPWSEVGSAAGEQLHQRMQQRGIGTISPQQGVEALSSLLTSPQGGAQLGVVPINWATFQQQGIHRDLFYANLLSSNAFGDAALGSQRSDAVTANRQSQPPPNHPQRMSAIASDWTQQLSELPQRRRLSFLTKALQSEVAQVLSFSEIKRVDLSVSFFDMGMDSLMSVELKNRLDTHLGYPIASTVIFEYPNIQSLADYLVEAYADNPSQEISVQEKDRPPDIQSPKNSADIEQELAALEELLNRT